MPTLKSVVAWNTAQRWVTPLTQWLPAGLTKDRRCLLMLISCDDDGDDDDDDAFLSSPETQQ